MISIRFPIKTLLQFSSLLCVLHALMDAKDTPKKASLDEEVLVALC
jgi:hypothetical protein